MKINIYMDDIRNPPKEEWEEYQWIPARKAEDVIYLLRMGVVEHMSLDHDMGIGEITGYELLAWMEEHDVWPSGNIWVHSANPTGAQQMALIIEKHQKEK